MIDNGHIRFPIETGGGQDINGNLVTPTVSYSEWIACNLRTLSQDYQLLVGGIYVKAGYSVYINPIEGFFYASSKQMEVRGADGTSLGVFIIFEKTVLTKGNRIKYILGWP